METTLRFLTKSLILLALMVHFTLITFFFGPISFLSSFVYGKVELIQSEEVPEPVALFLKGNAIHLSLISAKNKQITHHLAWRVLTWRKEKQMDEKERLAFDLSLLSFDQKVIGLPQASFYYFKKPLSELSDTQWVTLVNLHKKN